MKFTQFCPHCYSKLMIYIEVWEVPNLDWRDTPADELEVPVRVANCLKNGGIKTAGEANDRSDGELLRTPNFGRKSLKDLRLALDRLKKGAEDETPKVPTQEGNDA